VSRVDGAEESSLPPGVGTAVGAGSPAVTAHPAPGPPSWVRSRRRPRGKPIRIRGKSPPHAPPAHPRARAAPCRTPTMNPTPRIYLASKSPRRRDLLRQIGVNFDVLIFRSGERGEDADVDETPIPGEAVERYVERLALAKAQA